MSVDESMKIANEDHYECTMLGFLEKLPKGEPIPVECMSCPKLVKCALAKRAFDWYSGQKSPEISKDERINGTETPMYVQE